jgi:hypothetical protein
MAWVKSVEGGAVLWPRDRKREEDQRAALLLLLAVAAADVKQTRTTRANKCRGPPRAKTRPRTRMSCLAAAAIRHCQEPANPQVTSTATYIPPPGPYI